MVIYRISAEVVLLDALCSQAKHDTVKSPAGMLGGPGLWVSLTQAGSRLCNRSHVSAFVYTLGSQALSGNDWR